MSSEVGRASRRSRLGGSTNVNLIALDHGISMGWTDTQESPAEIARGCWKLGLHGVVCHVGLLGELRAMPLETFLQLHANTPADRAKSVVATPETALQADCVGVAVEYRASGDSYALSATAALIRAARDRGLLALVMANYDGEDHRLAATSIVGAAQLGADFVKVRLPSSAATETDRTNLQRVIGASPPTLVAGGDTRGDLRESLVTARALGMQGSCVGRHYFDPGSRADAVAAVRDVFP